MKTRWKPVDLICQERDDDDRDEIRVRTKLQRDARSAAMCVAEAVSYRVLEVLGFPLADAVVVIIDSELADGLAAQYTFDPPPVAGRHWGTLFLADGYGPDPASIDRDVLDEPADLFRMYLADEVLGNLDRRVQGNVLLRPTDGSSQDYITIPIDQSEAFGGVDCLRDIGCLQGRVDERMAQILPQAEAAAVHAGQDAVEQMFQTVVEAVPEIRAAADRVPDEWIDRGGVDPDAVKDFLEHRASNLPDLVDRASWLERCSLVDESDLPDLFGGLT